MKVFTILTVILAVGSLTSCNTLPKRSTSQLNWDVNIDQPIEQLEETLTKLDQQQPMNYTISNIAFLYDAKLYILFHQFINTLFEPARTKELNEQREWLKKQSEVIHKAYAEYEGGSLASFKAGQASINFTKQRIIEIERKTKELIK